MQLHREKAKIEAAGAELVFLGAGGPSFVRGFREKTGVDERILCDSSLRAYEAARLKRSVLRTLDPRAGVRFIASVARGFRQTGIQGDPHQQGGVLVIRPPGEVVYWHVSQFPGDNAPPEDILAALLAPNL